jgi:murein L,D-transpeptidase YafK
MKNTIYRNTLGKYNMYSALAAMLIVTFVVLGCGGGEKPAAPPTEAEAASIVKATMSDFARAIESGDFKAFRENSSKEFQTQFSDEQVKTTFKTFTDKKDVVAPILKQASTMDPKFSPAISVREEKGYHILVANGTFDTDEVPTKFQNEYVYQDGKWKLLKIQVNL